MPAPDYQRLRRQREEFHALYDADEATRARRLAALEREDPALAANLRDTLRRADAGRAEENPGVVATRVGRVLGQRYRLLREISTGGMGEVYLAERIDDVHKQVALKLVRTDLSLTRERARREQDILARLVHPHIAGLIDGGLSEEGWPWFAMDYIDGEHIDAWCDHRRLGLAARVLLFAAVCRAVHFAHKNLVLHRDLKPSNILIDADGAPRLLDFGIAKWLDAEDAGATHTLALTPAYASPEQLRGETATTASDVYQLGLVLYELAGGIAARKARANADAPTRVDRAFATLMQREPAAAERIAAARGERAARLLRLLHSDLARIAAKATADEAHERYDSAQALADDLERWSHGLPVAAHRGSFAYRAAKLIRRNAAAAAAIALLALGLVATSIVAVNRALSERAQRVLVEQQQRRSASLLEFLRDAFREGDPNLSHGEKLGAAELLERARDKLERRDDLDPATRAALQTQVAEVLLELGKADLALPTATAAVAALAPAREHQPVDYLRGVAALAEALQVLGKYREALDAIDPALPLARRTFGGDHLWLPYLLTKRSTSLMRLERLDLAQQDLDDAVAEFRELGDPGSQDFLSALNNLANVAINRGDNRQAVEFYREVVRIATERSALSQTDLMAVKSNLATNHYFLGDARTAIDILEPLVREYDALGLSAHNRTAYSRVILAASHLAAGDYERARAVLAAVPTGAAEVAAREPLTQWRLQLVQAKLALYTGHFERAIALLRVDAERALPSAQRKDIQRITTNALIAEAQLQLGTPDPTPLLERELKDAGRIAADLKQPQIPVQAVLEDCLGRAYLQAGEFGQAQTHLATATAQFAALQGADAASTVRSEIHRSWALALATRDAGAVARIAGQRDRLVAALGSEATPQVWQTDLLIDRLDRALGRPGIDDARRERAEAGLAALADANAAPRFVGLNGF